MPQTNNVFILDLPKGWKETTVYTFDGPNDSGMQHNLVLVIDPKPADDVDLKSYVQAQIHNSLSSLSGFEMLSEKELATAGGRPAYLICFKQVPAPDQILFQKQLYIVEKKAVCIFTSTYTKKTLQTISYEVDDMIKSFTLLDGTKVRELLDE